MNKPKRNKSGAPIFDDIKKSLSWHMQFMRKGVLHASQEDVARRCGISRAAYNTYETGKRAPNLTTFIRICHALYLSPETIIDDAEWEL